MWRGLYYGVGRWGKSAFLCAEEWVNEEVLISRDIWKMREGRPDWSVTARREWSRTSLAPIGRDDTAGEA